MQICCLLFALLGLKVSILFKLFLTSLSSGEAAENAAKFSSYLAQLGASALQGQEFCVFGVGSSLYPAYQQVPAS